MIEYSGENRLMRGKLKQFWGFLILLLVTVIYLIVFFTDFFAEKSEVKEIYFADRVTAAHKILIEKYNRENSNNVKVVPIDFPNFDFSTNERKELLARSLRGRGDGIDLFAVDLIWVSRFAKWCEPLSKYFANNEMERILNSALESCYFEGELVAVPLDLVQGIMYYRTDILDSLPNADQIKAKIENNITWEEFLKINTEIDKKDNFYIYPAADYEGLICSFMELVLSLKPDYFEENGFNMNTPEAKKSLKLLVDLIHRYNATPQIVSEFTEIPSYEYFIENDGLFIRGWPSYDKDFEQTPFESKKESYLRKAPIPHFKDGKPASVFGGWNLMVSRFSDKKEEVIDFIKFLLSDESQELFYKEAGYYPVIEKFYTDENNLQKYPELIGVRKLIASGVHRPAHVEYTRYSEIMSRYFESAIRKEITVEEALIKSTNAIQLDQLIPKD
ncbi:MAG: extracellular solute-binding protein [Melioribacteraceae bacterium]|nr:extracellular solute-binding protein [Melioribacteraceae bacterium]MCF8266143.1 extracellular solute-binding protein [Melioribacteraceae bacterium]MCF8432372.1 extracellular solute-binding protein [Melioribacteraceae bacterium]